MNSRNSLRQSQFELLILKVDAIILSLFRCTFLVFVLIDLFRYCHYDLAHEVCQLVHRVGKALSLSLDRSISTSLISSETQDVQDLMREILCLFCFDWIERNHDWGIKSTLNLFMIKILTWPILSASTSNPKTLLSVKIHLKFITLCPRKQHVL